MGYMTETHMLKPYPQRVAATRAFFDASLKLLAQEGKSIQLLRQKDRDTYRRRESAPIAWEVDRNHPARLEFHGYEASQVPSTVTGGTRLFYDRDKPFVRNIPYFNEYKVTQSVTLPAGYLIPREWHTVIDLMETNSIVMRIVNTPVTVPAETYRIDSFQSKTTPYEGHFFHDTVELTTVKETINLREGDVIIPMDQDRARYVVEALEPQAMDSLFRWNRFDSVLQQKEYFSPYVFEKTAEKLLADNQALREEFTARKNSDPVFAADRRAQLTFLYQRSANYEKSHRRYPIARLMKLPD